MGGTDLPVQVQRPLGLAVVPGKQHLNIQLLQAPEKVPQTLSFSYENLKNDLKWNRKCSTFEDFHKLNTGRRIMILLETKTSDSGRAILTNVREITEKSISAHSYCEKVYIENFLKMFGIGMDDDIRSMKDIAEKSETINRQYLMRREQEAQLLIRMGGMHKPRRGYKNRF